MTIPTLPGGGRRSPFAEALRALLDDTGFLGRAGWAGLLGVSTAALSQWVNDKTLPRADLLRVVLDILRSRGGPAAEPSLKKFDALLDAPSTTISPMGARMGADLRTFTTKRSFLDFARSLNGLDSESQLAALQSGSWGREAPEPLQLAVTEESAWPLQAALVRRLKEAWSAEPPRFEIEGSGPQVSGQAQWEHLAEARRAVVIGGPGSGKSTTISVLVRIAYDRGYKPALYSMGRGSAEHFKSWVAHALEKDGGRTIFIDGLDELPLEERRAGVRNVAVAADAASAARFLLASRPVPELDDLKGFERISIATLSHADLLAAIAHAARREDNLEPGESDRFLTHLCERNMLGGLLTSWMNFERAWKLFVRQAITPFWKAELLAECARALLYRDYEKGLSRVRAPWAAPACLAQLVGQLSFKLMETGSRDFDERDCKAWLSDRLPLAAHEQLLDLLTVKGVLEVSSARYSFLQEEMLHYFAARHCVESTADTATCLAAWPTPRPQLSVIACGISSDAGPLLRNVLYHQPRSDERYATLADMLAQPLASDEDTINECWAALLSWLDERVADWDVWKSDSVPTISSRWALLIRSRDTEPRVRVTAQVLEAVHRARSSPARDIILEHLENATSMFLAHFVTALGIEGYLRILINRGDAAALIRVEILDSRVEAPQPISPLLQAFEAPTRRLPFNIAEIRPRKAVADVSAHAGEPNRMRAFAKGKGAPSEPRATRTEGRTAPIRGPIETASGIAQFNEVDGRVQFVAIGRCQPSWLRLEGTEVILKPTSSPNVFELVGFGGAQINKLLLRHMREPERNLIEWG